MQHPFILISLVVIPGLARAQVILGPSDMPGAGDTIRYAITFEPLADVATTGAAYEWDYSFLTAGQEGADTMVTVGSTPLLYQFFFNNPLLYPQNVAGHAVRGSDVGMQGMQLEDVYDYFNAAGESYRNVGFGATINGLPASVRRLPVDHVHRFPIEFGDQDSSFSAYEMEIPTMGFFREQQWRYNQVDGWGTLHLPHASFDVLRVRSVLHRRDSVFIEQLGTGFAIDQPELIEYKWLAPGMGSPVLLVYDMGGLVTTARFHQGSVTGIGTTHGGPLPAVHPNPAQDRAWLHLPVDRVGVVELIDPLGRCLAMGRTAKGGGPVALDLAGSTSGVHVVRVRGAQGVWTQRLVVE